MRILMLLLAFAVYVAAVPVRDDRNRQRDVQQAVDEAVEKPTFFASPFSRIPKKGKLKWSFKKPTDKDAAKAAENPTFFSGPFSRIPKKGKLRFPFKKPADKDADEATASKRIASKGRGAESAKGIVETKSVDETDSKKSISAAESTSVQKVAQMRPVSLPQDQQRQKSESQKSAESVASNSDLADTASKASVVRSAPAQDDALLRSNNQEASSIQQPPEAPVDNAASSASEIDAGSKKTYFQPEHNRIGTMFSSRDNQVAQAPRKDDTPRPQAKIAGMNQNTVIAIAAVTALTVAASSLAVWIDRRCRGSATTQDKPKKNPPKTVSAPFKMPKHTVKRKKYNRNHI